MPSRPAAKTLLGPRIRVKLGERTLSVELLALIDSAQQLERRKLGERVFLEGANAIRLTLPSGVVLAGTRG